MKFIVLNDVKTAYYASGIGQRDVLFLHGWASSGRMWLRTMWALRHRYRMWAPDLPGFGDSHIPSIEWCSTEGYTDHVAAFCDALAIRPFAVIGHSMGGRLAFDMARRYPDRVERVAAISPALTGRLGFNLDVFMLGPLGRALKGVSRRVWAVAAASVMSQYWAPRYLTSEAVQRTSNDLRRATWEGSIGSLRAMVRQDYTPYLAEVQHPALVICGESDFTIPPGDSRLAASILPNVRLMMLKGIHHQPVDECPAEFLTALQAFLSAETHPNGRHARRAEAAS
jgi:pimeloyl-ACP methyl ester carboxylesterase